MDRERREGLKSLFEQARYLPATARTAFLDETCTDDPELRAELSSLLKAAESADPLFKELAEAVPPIDDRFTVSALTDAAVLVDRMVRQYRVEKMLGAGGMGVVYRAHDTLLNRTVALKFLPHHVVADEEAAERFVVEARAAAALDHPNVCAVHEIERDEEHGPFIAMAFCDGETLKRKLARGPVSVEEAVDYGAQIAAGLNAAHAVGIVHRDIKPGNLIVTSDGVVKILDFGLAKLADVTLTGTGITPGTVAYMSPEQTSGGELDTRTDFWSLGVVIYELLTGQRPFGGDHQGAVIHAIRHAEPEPPSKLRDEVPPDVEALVLGLLSKEPDDRCGSARALLGDLAPLSPRGAEPKRAAARSWTWGGERLISRVVGVMALVAIVGWVVVVLGGLRDDVPLDPDRVAVAVLTNLTGEAELDALGRQAAERITQAVHQREVADVAPTGVALAVADARGGRRGMDAVSALARASGAGVVLHGAYYVLGDSLHFQIQITDVSEGEVMSAMAPVSAPRDARAEALDLLEDRTLGALAAALDFRDGREGFPNHRPPSLEAYRLYKHGSAAWVRGETEEALELFEQARGMDSTWMPPLLQTVMALLERSRFAEADSITQLAARHLDHMSEPERLVLLMIRSYTDGEAQEAYLQSARRLAELAPIGLTFAYSAAWHTHRPQEGLEYLGRIDTTRANRSERMATERVEYTARMHHALGNHETELEVAKEGRRRFPEKMTLLHRHLSALGALGRSAEIEALLDTVLALPESRYRHRTHTPQGRVLGVGRELRAHGYSVGARTVLQRGYDWIELQPWEGIDAFLHLVWKAEYLYELGRWEEALDLYEQYYEWLLEQAAWDPDTSMGVLGYSDSREMIEEASVALASMACAVARLGDQNRARSIDVELSEKTDATLRRLPNRMVSVVQDVLLGQQARVAAVLGEQERAVRLLRQGFRVSPEKGAYVDHMRHRHIADFESLHDYLPYQQFLKPRG